MLLKTSLTLIYASLYSVCKFVAIEMQGIMEDTGKTREVLDIGSRFDKKPKRIPYKFS